MSDFSIRHPPSSPRRGRATTAASTTPTADEIFRVPSVEEVAAAGYPDPVAFRESIVVRYAEYRARFQTDAAFRADAIAGYRAGQERDAAERRARYRARRRRSRVLERKRSKL